MYTVLLENLGTNNMIEQTLARIVAFIKTYNELQHVKNVKDCIKLLTEYCTRWDAITEFGYNCNNVSIIKGFYIYFLRIKIFTIPP